MELQNLTIKVLESNLTRAHFNAVDSHQARAASQLQYSFTKNINLVRGKELQSVQFALPNFEASLINSLPNVSKPCPLLI